MVVGIISFSFFVLSLFYKKNKSLYIVSFIWLWILMAFTSGIADEKNVYMSRYYFPERWSGNSEILYNLIIFIFRKLNFSFYQFKAIITFAQLALTFSTIWKMAKYPNLVSCLYMIYPFPLNIAQMRHALATSIFVYAFRYLLTDDGILFKINKFKITKCDLKYCFFILIATCIHSASLLWLILLLAKKCSLRKNIFVMLLINFAIIYILSPANIMKIFDLFGAGSRINAYFSSAYQESSWRHYGGALLNVTFTAVMLIIFCFFILNKNKSFTNLSQVSFVLKANIIILCIYGLILKYTGEVYRLQESMTILNLVILTNALKNEFFTQKKWSSKNTLLLTGLMFFVCGIAYFSIGMYLIPTILNPILYNNIIINAFIK